MFDKELEKQAIINVKQRHKQQRKEKFVNFFKKNLWISLIFILGWNVAGCILLCPVIVASIYKWENIVANIVAFSWLGVLTLGSIIALIVESARERHWNKQYEYSCEVSKLYREKQSAEMQKENK